MAKRLNIWSLNAPQKWGGDDGRGQRYDVYDTVQLEMTG